ncbi:MAG: glycosyltransferase [Magnetococcales bacterium]|nr:glycosyltransferase [Magnetococcales bacterium]
MEDPYFGRKHKNTELHISIVIPVRDEVLNLKVMLRLLEAVLVDLDYEILVIVDREEDTSIPVVDEESQRNARIRLVRNQLGVGIANAFRAGVEEARKEWILIFAADEAGPLISIFDMFKLVDAGCRFISVTRYDLEGRRLGGSWIGHLFSWSANRLLHYISSLGLSDATSGIKMFRRDDFHFLTEGANSIGWAIAFEMTINAQKAGLTLGEASVISVDRLFGGKSTFRLVPWVLGYMKYFIMAIKELPPGNRPRIYQVVGDRVVQK